MAMSAIVANPLSWSALSDSPRSTSDTKNTSVNSTTWTMNSESESIAPADSADAGGMPNR